MNVAAHQVLQMVGVITGLERVGGIGPQMYHAYPERMDVGDTEQCEADCEYMALTATAVDLLLGLSS